MKILLFILSLLALMAGFFTMANTLGAMGEIAGILFWVIAAIFLVGAAILEAIK